MAEQFDIKTDPGQIISVDATSFVASSSDEPLELRAWSHINDLSTAEERIDWLLRTYHEIRGVGTVPGNAAADDPRGGIEIVQVLGTLLREQESEGIISVLCEGRAECFLDLMLYAIDNQTLLRKWYNQANLDQYALRVLVKLARTSNRFPPSLYIKGVQLMNRDAVCGGGYADIYLGSWRGKIVAVKRFRTILTESQRRQQTIQKTLYREALIWRSLNHEHILPLYGIDSDVFEPLPCMVSPWMKNGNINQYLDKHYPPALLITRLVGEIAEGLAYIHSQDFVHGDLRGANILIDDEQHARLSDFGLAILADMTQTTTGSGAARWMAPELHYPKRFRMSSYERTTATDVYAFAMFIDCLPVSPCIQVYTGHPPFSDIRHDGAVCVSLMEGCRPERPTIRERKMPDHLWEIVDECWNEQPGFRPAISQVCQDLTRGSRLSTRTKQATVTYESKGAPRSTLAQSRERKWVPNSRARPRLNEINESQSQGETSNSLAMTHGDPYLMGRLREAHQPLRPLEELNLAVAFGSGPALGSMSAPPILSHLSLTASPGSDIFKYNQ